MLSSFKNWILSIPPVKAYHARAVKREVAKQVEETLRLAHAAELNTTPIENWPQVTERHALQIQAVRDGKLEITDRRTTQWPYLPQNISRVQQPVIKMTPSNIRRFAKTPIPRRAINLIKGAIISLKWDVVPLQGNVEKTPIDTDARRNAVKNALNHPNNTDSWQSFIEEGIDDLCTVGAMAVEPQLTPDADRPIKMWNVDATTIRIYPTWTESKPNEPRYVQMTGLRGEAGAIPFLDRELLYIRDNPTVDTPFGTGKVEIAFQTIASFLGVQQMAGRAGSDQVHRTWLWWEHGTAPSNIDLVRRHLQNDLEGQSRINLMSGMKAPQVIDIMSVTAEDLLIPWQEFCIRIICAAFDMSAMSFLERDVNRAVGEVLDDQDFRSAVVPIAIRLQEAITRHIIHRCLGYTDLEFKFLNLEDPDIITKMQQLSQLYAMNAISANGINVELGRPQINSPFANLTQIELIFLQAETTSRLADQNAANAAGRQQDAQDRQFEQYQQMAPDEGGPDNSKSDSVTSSAVTAPSSPKLVTPKAPKLGKIAGPKLPKLPMAGSRYSAAQIAAMSLEEVQAAMRAGSIPRDIKAFDDAMESQEPGILMQMAPSVLSYLAELRKAQEKVEKGFASKPSPGANEKQRKRYKEMLHKPTPIEPNTGIVLPKNTLSNGGLGERKNTTNSRRRPSR